MVLKGSWQNTTPICAECGEPMTLQMVKSQYMYACPKCKKQQFSITYFEKILDKIAELDAERQMNFDFHKLDGEKFTIAKKLKCEIKEENDDMTKWTVAIKVMG